MFLERSLSADRLFYKKDGLFFAPARGTNGDPRPIFYEIPIK